LRRTEPKGPRKKIVDETVLALKVKRLSDVYRLLLRNGYPRHTSAEILTAATGEVVRAWELDGLLYREAASARVKQWQKERGVEES